jgi:hypothetical protein
MAILADDAPEQDLDLTSVWQRLRDLRLRRVEVFTMTRGEFDEWKRSLGTLAEIVASTGVVSHEALHGANYVHKLTRKLEPAIAGQLDH